MKARAARRRQHKPIRRFWQDLPTAMSQDTAWLMADDWACGVRISDLPYVERRRAPMPDVDLQVDAGAVQLVCLLECNPSWWGVLSDQQCVAMHLDQAGVNRRLIEKVLDIGQPALSRLLARARAKLQDVIPPPVT